MDMNTSSDISGPQPRNEEKSMNAPSQAMNIRLSRISYPRATWWAMLLLVAVFLVFGLWAEAALPAAQTSTLDWQSSLPSYAWLTELGAVWS